MTFDACGTAVATEPVESVVVADESKWKITKTKSIRLDDNLWDELGAAASKVGHDRAGVIRQFILWYLRKPGADLPQRPGK
jgi:hypothetical protein